MAGEVENARIWIDADVYTGPTTATAPTDLETPLDEDFEALGLLSEDGTSESRDEDKTDHYAWGGGGRLVRTTRSKHKRTIKVIALEDNPVVFGLTEPGSDADTVDGVTTRIIRTPQPNPRSFVFEMADGDIHRRRYIPRGEVLDVGDITDSDSAISQKELTITVYPIDDDDLGANVLYVDITDDPQAEEGGS